MDPQTLQIVIALAGAVVGYLARHYGILQPAAPANPAAPATPAVAPAVPVTPAASHPLLAQFQSMIQAEFARFLASAPTLQAPPAPPK